ncbi:MAG TPA: thermonuclease family protein [Candidatus Polarisedimenticolaceae bacterium]|nr:thermonuclease family protein [Candidatus Polarisedimenticolaceae bacterium]
MRALATAAAIFATCAAGESGTVVDVVDGDTLRLSSETGTSTVRLLGVDTPELGRADHTAEFLAKEAHAFTRALVDGRRVRLERDATGDTVDRYGRALGYVFLDDGRLLNALILSEGYGQAYTRFPFSRIDEFRRLEREAREAGRGLWDPRRVPTLAAADALAHAGRTATVCDRVASTRYLRSASGEPTFLNLARPYPDQPLTVVIWGADRPNFDEPETRLRDRTICVTGKIRRFGGHAEIAVNDPSQIVVGPPS